MLLLSVSLCQIKNRVIICSVVRYSVDAAIMQCLYEMVRGFIAVIPRWLKRFPCHGVRIKMADLEQVVFETIRAQMCPALGIDSNKDKLICRQSSGPNMKKKTPFYSRQQAASL